MESSIGQRTPFGIYTNDPSLNTAEFKAAKKLSRGPTTEPRYFFTKSGCSRTASLNEQKIIPFSNKVSLNVVLTDTESMTASTAIPLNAICSSKGIPNLLKVLINSGSTSSILFSSGMLSGETPATTPARSSLQKSSG